MTAAAFSSSFFLQSWLDFMRLCSFCGGVFSQGRNFLLHPHTLVSKQDNGKNLLWFLHTLVSALADYPKLQGNRNEVSWIKTEDDKRLCCRDVTKCEIVWNVSLQQHLRCSGDVIVLMWTLHSWNTDDGKRNFMMEHAKKSLNMYETLLAVVMKELLTPPLHHKSLPIPRIVH